MDFLGVGFAELIFILIIAMMVFGPRRLPEIAAKAGKIYEEHAGLCMECQGYPDGVNSPEIDDIILRPGQTYRRQTEYRFSIASE